jgi:hypothetical protein
MDEIIVLKIKIRELELEIEELREALLEREIKKAS